MKPDTAKIDRLISELEGIRQSAFWLEGEFEAELGKVAESSRESARNLLHYLALRRRDFRVLQEELDSLGLSSLGGSEAQVMGTVEAVLSVLHQLRGRIFDPDDGSVRAVRYPYGKQRLLRHTEELFGHLPSSEGTSRARIMVTMPSSAAVQYDLVKPLVESGMTCMRINCAHDSVEAWEGMVRNLERARTETGRQCRLLMDLGGPKLRTGEMIPGPRVLHWEPKRNELGEVVAPALVWLTPAENPEPAPLGISATLPLAGEKLALVRSGDKLRFLDRKGKSRALRVSRTIGSSWLAESRRLTYVDSTCVLKLHRKGEHEPLADLSAEAIPPLPLHLRLRAGDTLRLTRNPRPATPVRRGTDGKHVEIPAISCTTPDVFATVKSGERILFDDGKIEGVVASSDAEALEVSITHPPLKEKKLRGDKGVNFPDTALQLPALTEKDLRDLDFVVRHADIVALSFVNSSQDIEELQRQISRRTSRRMGIVLKIETARAFEQLPRLLLTALRNDLVGVMIARGDLAVECGYERLAEIQEEILWICEAAHVPVVWATQVLETLSKKGMPSRAEVTDAAMAERAECVMLNKGPHIVTTVRMLGAILGRMHAHQHKRSPTLRALGISRLPEPR